MNDSVFASFALKPELKDAVDRWMEAGKSGTEEWKLLESAFNPMQTYLQITSKAVEFVSGLDWQEFYNKTRDPEALSQITTELSDLQKAALNRYSDDNQALFDTLMDKAKEFAAPDISDPQKSLAEFINSSLDTLESVKEKLDQQTQTTVSIQSAFMAWYQQSLSSLATPPVTARKAEA